MSNPQFAVGLPPGREHIPLLPRGFIAIRIVQLVLSLIVLGLAAYGISYIPFDGNNFILAVAIMTMLSSIYHLVARYGPPAAYNYWAVLGLDVFFVLMWLCSFALLAARVGATFALVDTSYSYSYLSDYELIWLASQAAAAGLGGIEFILFLVSLIIHSIHLHRHRAAGLHCTPGTPPGPRQPTTTAAPTVVYTDKAGNPIYQQQQQQPYTQQPVPGHLQGQPPPFYPAPGYAPVPMNHMQGQPVPVQGMPIQMQQLPPQQQQYPQQYPQQQYPQQYPQQQQQQQQPQPQPQPIVPQPTGDSQAPSSLGAQQPQPLPQQQQQQPQHAQMQPTPPPPQQQAQHSQPHQAGGVVAGELGGSQVDRD